MIPIASHPTLTAVSLFAIVGYLSLGPHTAHADNDVFGGRLTGTHPLPLYHEPASQSSTMLRAVNCLGHAQGALCFATR
jgi:hypothetical protein